MRPKTPRSLLSTPSIAAPIPTRPDALHRQSQSPYRFLVPFSEVQLDEKQPGSELPHIPPSSSRSSAARRMPPRTVSRTPTPTPEVVQHTYGYPAPTRTPLPAPCTLAAEARHSLWRRAWQWFKPWIPISLWVATSVGFLLAIAFWRTEVFEGLDNFSHWLQEDGWEGYAILGVLIFITTIPPFPLYSTFMTLSGYAFGALPGAVISYIASLVGAVTVFLLSRAYLSDYIGSFFERSPSFKRVVRAIEKRPNVLFLVRLAPYPYNVMNVLLAASPTLTLRTYTICTGLALFKVIIHTTLGASIHSFSHHGGSTSKPTDGETGSETPADDEDEDSTMSRALQIGGIVLCVGVFLYISWVARRAVDNEADDDDDRAQNAEEREAFLPRRGRDSASSGDLMTEADLGHNEPRSVARMHFIDTTSTTDIVVVPSPSPSPRPLSR